MANDEMNEIECPHCGEYVYYEVLVCPKCGVHFYEEDEIEDGEQKEDNWTGQRFSIAGVLAGTVVAGFVGFLVGRGALLVWPDQQGVGFQIFILAAGPTGTLAGGYLAGLMAGGRGVLNGLAVGTAAVIPAYFLEAYWRDLSVEALGATTVVAWGVMVVCGALGGWLWEHLHIRPSNQANFRPRVQLIEKDQYLELLAQVHYDIDTAERLIDLERRKNPEIPRAALIQRAIERLQYDRR